MRIHRAKTGLAWPGRAAQSIRARRFLRFCLLALVLLGVIAAFTLFGMYKVYTLTRADRIAPYENRIISLAQIRPSIIRNWFRGLRAEVDTVYLDIKHKHFQKLAYQREVALLRNYHFASSEDFVPARLRFKNASIKTQIRLKGDRSDHLQGENWSFRVETGGDSTFRGMKRFSLHRPATRNFLHEWLFHEVLRREGLVALRYEFVDLVVNGKGLGTYAIEEHIDKRLLEANGRREGPVLRFDETMFWKNMEALRGIHNFRILPSDRFRGSFTYGSFQSSQIDAFQSNRIQKDAVLSSQFEAAAALLEGFRRGDLLTSEVFDIRQLAVFYALTDLTGAWHGTKWFNHRFYYNPVTTRLEPVGFDADAGHAITDLSLSSAPGTFNAMVFSDLEFTRAYIKELRRLSQTEYLDAFFAELDDGTDERLAVLYRTYPHIHHSTHTYYKNQEVMRHDLQPPESLRAHVEEMAQDRVTVSAGNIQSVPVDVLGLFSGGDPVAVPAAPHTLRGKLPGAPITYERILFTTDRTLESTNLVLRYRLYGDSRIQEESVMPWRQASMQSPAGGLLRQAPNAETFSFVSTNGGDGVFRIQPGDWTIDRPLVFPAGGRVEARAGTRLSVTDGGIIISHSPLDFVGTEASPIHVASDDHVGQGLAVMNAGEQSILRHVNFSGLSNPRRGAWSLTGAVTFYHSPVLLADCAFSHCNAEDSLNLIHSPFQMCRVLFEGSASDACDADFSDGLIENTTFQTSGNDALDISGSYVELTNVTILGADDKGLSAGEASRVDARGLTIRDVAIAVASKDLSEVRLFDTTITKCKV